MITRLRCGCSPLVLRLLLESKLQLNKSISTCGVDLGKKNFRELFVGNKRWTRGFKEVQYNDPDAFPDIPPYTEVKEIGYRYGKKFRRVPEMIPELIVPDLTGFNLKAYVSYKVAETSEPEFTPKELFSYVYQKKIESDFKEGRLDRYGNALDESEEEKLSAEEGWMRARQTGCDIFTQRIPEQWECLKQPVD